MDINEVVLEKQRHSLALNLETDIDKTLGSTGHISTVLYVGNTSKWIEAVGLASFATTDKRNKVKLGNKSGSYFGNSNHHSNDIETKDKRTLNLPLNYFPKYKS